MMLRFFFHVLAGYFLGRAIAKGPAYTARYLARRQVRRRANRAIRKYL